MASSGRSRRPSVAASVAGFRSVANIVKRKLPSTAGAGFEGGMLDRRGAPSLDEASTSPARLTGPASPATPHYEAATAAVNDGVDLALIEGRNAIRVR
jgi:hypothetical protein